MSWIYVPASADSHSPESGSSETGTPSATSKLTNTASECLRPESKMASSVMPPSGATLRHSTGEPGVDAWISSLRASPANHSQSQDAKKEKATTETSGQTSGERFAKYDPSTSCWRTSQLSLLTPTLEPYSGSWPRAGTMRSGHLYDQTTHTIPDGDYSFPRIKRPIASDANGSARVNYPPPGHSTNLQDWWNKNYRFAYPPVRITEYLMGFPIEWTDSKPLETQSFQQWLQKHGRY